MKLYKKIVCILFIMFLSFLPIEIFIGLWLLVHPTTFWQRLLSVFLGCVFFVPIQLGLFVIGVVFIGLICSQIASKQHQQHQQRQFNNRIEKYK